MFAWREEDSQVGIPALHGGRFWTTAASLAFIIAFVREEGGGRHEGTRVRSVLLRGGMEMRSLERTSIQPRAPILATGENRAEKGGGDKGRMTNDKVTND